MNQEIINKLPTAFTGQTPFLIKQGQDFINEMFDECGREITIFRPVDIARRMPLKYGQERTRTDKTRAAISYVIAEGAITGEP